MVKRNSPARDGKARSWLDWSSSLLNATSFEVLLQDIADQACRGFADSHCGLWWLDTSRNGFRLVRQAELFDVIDPDANFLSYDDAVRLGLLSTDEAVPLPSDCEFSIGDYPLPCALAARVHYEDRTSGILIIRPEKVPHTWTEEERDRLKSIAEIGGQVCRNFETLEKLPRLVELLQEMSEKTLPRDLYELILKEVKTLLPCDRAVIRGINLQDGHLTHEDSTPKPSKPFSIPAREGITGLAVTTGRTYRIADVTDPKWAETYLNLWPNLPPTRSELAVPLIYPKYRVRTKTHNEHVEKTLGVLNFESPVVGAFSALDRRTAEALALRMAHVMEKIQYDQKLGKVRVASQLLATRRDWVVIVDELLEAIRDSLGYEFVSLSIVDQDVGVIRCERVIGLPQGDPEQFRRDAEHKLDSNHVQAHVVRDGSTDVPDPDDPRLEPINKKYGLNKLIRVFVPMKVKSRDDEVIGTVCAGYDKTYRPHIYWRDLELLRILVSFGTNAMDLWHRNDIVRVSHEMNAPLTAVRANLETLHDSMEKGSLTDDHLKLALEDMSTDTNVLYYQMQRFGYVIGGKVADAPKQPLKIELVALFKDVIIKTLAQLRTLIIDEGLNPKNVSYEDMYKVKSVYVDKSKISQVIFNLFMNAVKYAKNPETFKIRIGAEESRNSYIIKFCDWGIGVPKGLEERIFEDRFRAPSVGKVSGQGLGLTIARELLREHGGDLILKNRQDPTEFHLIFPKRLRREP